MQKPFHPWRHGVTASLVLMAPFDVLASLALDIYLPVIPSMPSALGSSADMIQLTLSVYLVLLGTGQLLFGPLSDRIGRRPVVLAGGLLFTLASLGLAVSTSAMAFLLLRLLQACGAAAMLVAAFATVRDVFADRPEGATIYGLFGAILAFVPALGPILGAVLMRGLGWRAIFLLLAGLGAVATLHAWLRWPETGTTTRAGSHDPRPILRDRAFRTYTLGFATALGGFFVFFSTAPRILVTRVGLSELAFSLCFASVAAMMIVAGRCLRPHIARWGIETSLRRAMLLMVAGGVLLIAAQAAAVPQPWALLAPMWITAIGIVLAVSVTANGALASFGDRAGLATALHYCLEGLIAGAIGTGLTLLLPADGIWPLATFCLAMPLATWLALERLGGRSTSASA
ncbi:CmlA/FloR family chloramphenicol efflux MFS transporter [Sphingomonas histidinilytica]|jgi:DHA1 family florfenicol/chloramphenicol resistance protein-like MFS transporter|uniref:Bcr/CflA family efflux transporter n=1 Tax=Rhizorhabdus histidinilytica TaxID=439228 RepID=A0A1T5AX75_9SPHN|nr:CmlA/FloR family chloramphenicol efflux MFS transporter [Rhizorhabdus histidinilytica]MBO9377727.1 CmlA/FloR family chloramphenicol efflux MFS transporter [Rhizorhabdus histidinilytica]QEH79556.1 multidrug effflux MFS transporter [Sphingomonas sp. C8-2]SKB39641.1 MFS transporter, DHA1 family, florfenicol/chloramphenicol resistance protein [Rhizorhabdus histidinilytica]